MRRLLPIGLAVALLLAAGPTASADPAVRVIPSFNESQGCGPLQGYRGPIVPIGSLSDSVRIWGPWGDFYGRTIGEVRDNLVPVTLPGQDWHKSMWVHSRLMPAMTQAIANLEAAAEQGLHYTIRSSYTSSFNPRSIGGRGYLSFHGVGAAIDINSHTNPYSGEDDNELITNMPSWFVEAWTDAGWCWGGDWIDIKDPMHYSWMGPLHTPDYGPMPPPFPPLTSPAPFNREVPFVTGLDGGPAVDFATIDDVDRDGAPDVVGLREWTPAGHIRVEAAVASSEFAECETASLTTRPFEADDILMGDIDRDGRPDLWALDLSGGTLRITPYPMASGLAGPLPQIETPAAVDGISTYLAGDVDRDGYSDLVMITPAAATRVRVWKGPGLTEPLLDATSDLAANGTWRFSLGDFDVDGILDVYALSGGDARRLSIVDGATGFAGPAERVAGDVPSGPGHLQVADLDGDGRDDLYILDEDGGGLVVLMGNRRPAGADLTKWFHKDPSDAGRCTAWAVAPGDPEFGDLALAALADGSVAVSKPEGPGTYRLLVGAMTSDPTGRIVPGGIADVETLATGFAILTGDTDAVVEIVDGSGSVTATIHPGGVASPRDLAVVAAGTGTRLAVVGETDGSPIVALARMNGNPISSFHPDLENAAALIAADLDGGDDELVVVGTDAAGRAMAEAYTAGGRFLMRTSLGTERRVVDAAPVGTAGSPGAAVLTQDVTTGALWLIVLDGDLNRVARIRYPAALTAAMSGDGATVVVGFRIASTGRVRIDAYDTTGGFLWRTTSQLGFDPGALFVSGNSIWVASQRMGDGRVLVHERSLATGGVVTHCVAGSLDGWRCLGEE